MTKLLVAAVTTIGTMLMLAARTVAFPVAVSPPRVCRHHVCRRRSFLQTKTTPRVVTRRMIATTRSSDAAATITTTETGMDRGGTETETGAETETGTTQTRSDATLSLSSLPEDLNPWFDVALPEGRCIGVETANETECFADIISSDRIENDHWIRSVFHRDEVAMGMDLKRTRNSFWLGRLAMRMALDFPDYPILRDQYGRPELRPGRFGSISHKRDKGVAIVSPSIIDQGNPDIALSGVGVDLEVTSRPGRPSLSRRILTPKEQAELGKIPGLTIEQEVLLRFSLKEAIYKAAHPLLCQYVGFKEAEVTPFPDGTASCLWLLDNQADRSIAKLTAHWRTIDDGNYFLTSASVYSRADAEATPIEECTLV